MAKAYEGTQPYIFISYSHKDTAQVMTVVDDLEKRGYRVWYDGGIEAGSEWPEYIAKHLRGCKCVIAFISQNYVNSTNCRRELVFAQNLDIPQLNVYFSDSVQLSDGLQLQLGLNQSLWKNRYPNTKAFCDALAEAKMLEPCRQAVSGTAHVTGTTAKTGTGASAAQTQSAPAGETIPESQFNHKQIKKASRRSSFPEILHIPLAYYVMTQLPYYADSGWEMFLIMLIPHTLMALWARASFRRHSKGLSKPEISKANDGPFGWWLVGCFAVAILGAFALDMDREFMGRLLTSIGLNLAPGIISCIILATIL